MTRQEVQQAIEQFSPEEFAMFRVWLEALAIEREAQQYLPIELLAGICADDPILLDDAGIIDAGS
ncbi:MAG: hypothetical protein ACPGVO_03675 [Spirulinaceae cyanobacterium]